MGGTSVRAQLQPAQEATSYPEGPLRRLRCEDFLNLLKQERFFFSVNTGFFSGLRWDPRQPLLLQRALLDTRIKAAAVYQMSGMVKRAQNRDDTTQER